MRVDEAMDILLPRMPDFGCMPNAVSCNTLINGLFGEGEVEKAYNLFLKMLDRGISPNVVTYNTIIDGMCKAQTVD